MCGPAGSGKSTYARQLELQGMVRLSFDEESFKRNITVHPLPDTVHDEIKKYLDQKLVDLISQNINVVLDYSFWSREMRDEYKEILRPYDIEPEIIQIVTPKEVILERISNRTGAHANDIRLTEKLAAQYYNNFQPPTIDEGNITIIKGY